MGATGDRRSISNAQAFDRAPGSDWSGICDRSPGAVSAYNESLRTVPQPKQTHWVHSGAISSSTNMQGKTVSPQIRITREAMFLEPTVAEFPPPWQHCCPWSVMTMNTRKKCLCSSNYIPGNGCRRILARLRCTSIRKATRSRHSRPSASGATRARTCPPTSLGGSRVLQARGIRGRVSTRG